MTDERNDSTGQEGTTSSERRAPKDLLTVALDCPHVIDAQSVTLRFDPSRPGHNALNQLSRRLADAQAGLARTHSPQAAVEHDTPQSAQRSAQLLEALQRLSRAALSRDGTMGDPCALLEAKAELNAARKHADEVIAAVRGGTGESGAAARQRERG